MRHLGACQSFPGADTFLNKRRRQMTIVLSSRHPSSNAIWYYTGILGEHLTGVQETSRKVRFHLPNGQVLIRPEFVLSRDFLTRKSAAR